MNAREHAKGPIVVAVGPTPSGARAWREALARAERGRLPLVAVRVVPALVGVNVLFPPSNQSQIEGAATARADARRQLDALAAAVGAVQVTTVLAQGDPAVEIVRIAEARDASLVVLGDSGARNRLSVGRVADRIIRHAHCAVLIARAQAPTGIIVGGTDFSDGSLPVAAAVAREAAARVGGTAVLVHALDPVPWFQVAPYAVPEVIPYVDAAAAKEEVRERLRRALAAQDARGEAVVVEGAAGPALIETAAALDAELVVVGTVGRTGMPRLLLGNVAEMVVRSTACSVLVVRLHR